MKGNSPSSTLNYMGHVFELEYPLGSDKRIRFEKINDAEDKQLSNFALQITPKSTPCN